MSGPMSFKKKKRGKKRGGTNESSERVEREPERDEGMEREDAYDLAASDEDTETLSKWYNEIEYRQRLEKIECDDSTTVNLKSEAERVFEDETKAYHSCFEKTKKSNVAWISTVMKTGTSKDKVAAHTLMVQQSPVHNFQSLLALTNMAKVAKKQQFILALETLADLFVSDLLPPGKKLKRFEQQPLAHLSRLANGENAMRRKLLCFWLFEDKLKRVYAQFVALLARASHDTIQANREKAIGTMVALLKGNRELENELLSNLINKLGDPTHKVAAKVVYGLESAVRTHPSMKVMALDEIEKMLFRPHIAPRAQYYAICFLSQLKMIRGEDGDLSKRLISVYFCFFKACVKTGDIDSRLMGALLTGVNRAYPFAVAGGKKGGQEVIPTELLDTMYKVVHLSPFKISLQALSLLLQISNSDRFYNALYKKLLDKELSRTSHQGVWLNLTFKAVRKDENIPRVKAFVKRVLQVSQYFPAQLAAATLVMLSHVVKRIPDVEENFVLGKDGGENGVGGAGNAAFHDDKDETWAAEGNSDVKSNAVSSSWFHRNISRPNFEAGVEKKFPVKLRYDPAARNPAFAGGEKAVMVELTALSRHFHPSVVLFAQRIVRGERVYYTGDPLRDFTLLRFLDRFSFKNPKIPRLDKGEDKEELFRSAGSQRKHYAPVGLKAFSVQSDHYLSQSEAAIPTDELFLYKYLKEKRKTCRHLVEKKRGEIGEESDDDSDGDSVGSVEFEDYLDGILGGDGGDDDLDFADDVGNTKKQKSAKSSAKDDEGEEDSSVNHELALSEEELDWDDGDGSSEGEVDEDANAAAYNAEDSDEDEDGNVDREEDADGDSASDFNEDDLSLSDIDVSESEEDESDKKLPLKTALQKRIGRDFTNSVVPTDKFAEMLEEAGRKRTGGFDDLSNNDNAGEKQLKWEMKRSSNGSWKGRNNENRFRRDRFENRRGSSMVEGGGTGYERRKPSNEFEGKKQRRKRGNHHFLAGNATKKRKKPRRT